MRWGPGVREEQGAPVGREAQPVRKVDSGRYTGHLPGWADPHKASWLFRLVFRHDRRISDVQTAVGVEAKVVRAQEWRAVGIPIDEHGHGTFADIDRDDLPPGPTRNQEPAA